PHNTGTGVLAISRNVHQKSVLLARDGVQLGAIDLVEEGAVNYVMPVRARPMSSSATRQPAFLITGPVLDDGFGSSADPE
ncbi:hypothetical protein ABTF68_20830, partial [Acinetobacter baumannii]